MSDIKVGDLVVVVRACCDGQARHQGIQGVPWRVTSFKGPAMSGCQWCGAKFYNVVWAMGAPNRCPYVWVRWLKRIPPLSDLERVTEKEELPA